MKLEEYTTQSNEIEQEILTLTSKMVANYIANRDANTEKIHDFVVNNPDFVLVSQDGKLLDIKEPHLIELPHEIFFNTYSGSLITYNKHFKKH